MVEIYFPMDDLVRQVLGHSKDGHNPQGGNIPSLCTQILDMVVDLHRDMGNQMGDGDVEVDRVGVMTEAIFLQQVEVDICGMVLPLALQI